VFQRLLRTVQLQGGPQQLLHQDPTRALLRVRTQGGAAEGKKEEVAIEEEEEEEPRARLQSEEGEEEGEALREGGEGRLDAGGGIIRRPEIVQATAPEVGAASWIRLSRRRALLSQAAQLRGTHRYR
jgi:hypothetical protein